MLMIHNYTYIFFLSSLKLPDSYRNPEQASSSHAESSTFHVDHNLLAVSHLLFANTSPLVLLMLLALCKTSSIFLSAYCIKAAGKLSTTVNPMQRQDIFFFLLEISISES